MSFPRRREPTKHNNIMKIEVKVIPGAKINQMQVGFDGNIKVWVTQIAEDGKANRKVIEMLAKHFKTAKSNIKILYGHKERRKLIEVDN